jgi:carbamoyltransferase
LISAFKLKTGCPVLVNTSFNVRGEPLVCSPADAFRCFMGTEIELLAVGNCILRKEQQKPELKLNYETAFELD